MVNAQSSLVFKATLENAEFDQGMRRIKGDLRVMQVEADKSNSSLERMGAVTQTIATRLLAVGAAGVGALTAMATQSPAVAGEMAKIKNEMREMSFTAGENLKPVFESIANDLLPALNERLSKTGEGSVGFLDVFANGLERISQLLDTEPNNSGNTLANILLGGGGALVGGYLGSFLGPAGTVAGASIGGTFGLGLANTEPNYTPFNPTSEIGPYGTITSEARDAGLSPMDPAFFPGFINFLSKLIGREIDKGVVLVTPSAMGGGGSI